MNADRIYILEKGRIIDSGTHTELYQSSVLYREMVDLQHDGFVGEDE
jgi:ABC-type multidrug transport system fused ATPase/permease subunit